MNAGDADVVFTIASELRQLWLWNKRRFATLLFREARDTLYHLLGEERRLGDARPGFLATLHTWGGTLIANPHLHCHRDGDKNAKPREAACLP